MTSSDILGCKDSPQILFDNIICYSKTWLLKVKIWNTNNNDMLSYLIKLFSLTISTNFVLPTAVWNFVLIGSSQSKHDECFLVLIIISWTLLDASPNQWMSGNIRVGNPVFPLVWELFAKRPVISTFRKKFTSAQADIFHVHYTEVCQNLPFEEEKRQPPWNVDLLSNMTKFPSYMISISILTLCDYERCDKDAKRVAVWSSIDTLLQ